MLTRWKQPLGSLSVTPPSGRFVVNIGEPKRFYKFFRMNAEGGNRPVRRSPQGEGGSSQGEGGSPPARCQAQDFRSFSKSCVFVKTAGSCGLSTVLLRSFSLQSPL